MPINWSSVFKAVAGTAVVAAAAAGVNKYCEDILDLPEEQGIVTYMTHACRFDNDTFSAVQSFFAIKSRNLRHAGVLHNAGQTARRELANVRELATQHSIADGVEIAMYRMVQMNSIEQTAFVIAMREMSSVNMKTQALVGAIQMRLTSGNG